ncbi:MAG: hypothetical protein IKH65_07815, partial [Clostridia bacterium]|nr:hypothetical protein [Clostridia bacterium]
MDRENNHEKKYIATAADNEQTVFFDVSQPPFTVHGLLRDEAGYYRLPYDVAAAANDGVKGLNLHTAGGRLRFRTNADRIVLRAKMREITRMQHFALTGSAGFDLYADNNYMGTFLPKTNTKNGFSAILETDKKTHDYTINFPLFDNV